MRKILGLIFILCLCSYSVRAADGCFTVIAGKAATVDGCVLMGHNEDNGIEPVAGVLKVERREHGPEEYIQLPGGGKIPQVKTTFGFWYLRMPEKLYSDGLMNEFGVTVVSNNCPSREDKPELIDGGIAGPILRRLVAERAMTAREGVKLVGSLIEKFGYCDSGRTLCIADPNEGWLVSMVNGRHWVARRVPDDMVAVIANTYTIREVDLSDSLNCLGSEDLIKYAQKRGWFKKRKNLPFIFEEAYSDPENRISLFNTHRQWSGLRRIAAEEIPVPENARLPFAVKPKKLLSQADIAEILRDHYEDTPYDPGIGYENRPAHKRHTGTICGPYTNSSSIFQLRSQMPVEIGAVWWLAMWQPCSTPYIPIYLGMPEVPGEYGFGPDTENSTKPLPGKAYDVFGKVAEWVNEDYAERITVLRDSWQKTENTSYKFQKSFENILVENWKDNPSFSRELMIRYTQGIISGAIQQANEIMSPKEKKIY